MLLGWEMGDLISQAVVQKMIVGFHYETASSLRLRHQQLLRFSASFNSLFYYFSLLIISYIYSYIYIYRCFLWLYHIGSSNKLAIKQSKGLIFKCFFVLYIRIVTYLKKNPIIRGFLTRIMKHFVYNFKYTWIFVKIINYWFGNKVTIFLEFKKSTFKETW